MDRSLRVCPCGHSHISGRERHVILRSGQQWRDAHSLKSRPLFVLSDRPYIRKSNGRRTSSKAREEKPPSTTSPIGACVSSSRRAEHEIHQAATLVRTGFLPEAIH